jgi:hypothetical protein
MLLIVKKGDGKVLVLLMKCRGPNYDANTQDFFHVSYMGVVGLPETRVNRLPRATRC